MSGSSIDKEQPDQQREQQDCEAVGTGKHQPENQSAQRGSGNSEPD
jgi:hypothetical protein